MVRKHAGQPLRRLEDPRLLTGAARYVDDLRFADLLHVDFLRSPHAHALIKSIDAAAARALPGVAGVFTHEDLRGRWGGFPVPGAPPAGGGDGGPAAKDPPRPPLADGEVCYAGQPVAAVAAESSEVARDALELIDVRYEPLPAALDAAAALEAGAPRAHASLPDNVAFRWERKGGDTEEAFRKADRVVRVEIRTERVVPCPLEPRGAVARWLPGEDELTVWTSTQSPHLVRAQLAHGLGLPESRVRVAAPEVGGAFGSKLGACAEEAVLAVLARLLAPRPLKWIEARRESMASPPHGRGQRGALELALRSDGKVLGVRYEAVLDLGAWSGPSAHLAAALAGSMACGAYAVPAASVAVAGVLTNKAPAGGCRGAGRAEMAYAIERAMDLAAAELELDPVEVRRANFPRSFPHGTAAGAVYDSGDYAKTLDRVLELCDMPRLRAERDARRRRGELVGIGLATYVDLCGPGPSRALAAGGWEAAAVRVGPAGAVDVFTGACPHGQGQETAFAQLAADRLGVSPEDVRVHRGDTALVAGGGGTFGSRGTAVGGSAVHEAARRVEAKMRRIAGAALGVPAEYVEHAGRRFVAGARSIAYEEVCHRAHRGVELPEGLEPGLEAACAFEPRSFTFPFGAHVCLASVDRETGEPRLEGYWAADDCGRAVNPLLAEGQAHGGIVQGIGQALLERAAYDEAGQLLTGGFLDYALPRARGLPWLRCDRTETPTGANPLGAKGAGEAGAIAATPAVVNAVVDALSILGVRHLDPPLLPERIWRVLRERSGP
ncbi:MAG: xanthine dehydrogenase family protein [Planctomycetes bacterium]|nr:xanthine dehydrogenase family protein [Planctomycetota bacterium]